MSASCKPPRRKSGPAPPSPALVARVLVDADTLGDRYAAKRHKVSTKTIERWRLQYDRDPDVSELVARLRAQVNAGWIDKARAARARLIESVVEAAESPKATLRERTDALRRVHEVVMSHEVLNDPGEHRRDGDAQAGEGPAGGAGAGPDAGSAAGGDVGGDPGPRDHERS